MITSFRIPEPVLWARSIVSRKVEFIPFYNFPVSRIIQLSNRLIKIVYNVLCAAIYSLNITTIKASFVRNVISLRTKMINSILTNSYTKLPTSLPNGILFDSGGHSLFDMQAFKTAFNKINFPSSAIVIPSKFLKSGKLGWFIEPDMDPR